MLTFIYIVLSCCIINTLENNRLFSTLDSLCIYNDEDYVAIEEEESQLKLQVTFTPVHRINSVSVTARNDKGLTGRGCY